MKEDGRKTEKFKELKRKAFLGNTIWKRRKSKTNSLKGKTYEDIHGKERAEALKELRKRGFTGRPRTESQIRASRENGLKYKGEKNPFFNKRHTKETRQKISISRRGLYRERQTVNKQVRRYWRVNEWRNFVFERDKYICQMCGAHNYSGLGTSIKLHAHHIRHLSDIIGNMSFSEAVKNPELYDINNGITLCLNCHKQIHAKRDSDD
jgi:5-methylcytosine-specific restriction endonuclease McrA